jgi:hypothetical protein
MVWGILLEGSGGWGMLSICWNSLSYGSELWAWGFELWVQLFELWVQQFELWVQQLELWVQQLELKVQNFEPWVQNFELYVQFPSFNLKLSSFKLQIDRKRSHLYLASAKPPPNPLRYTQQLEKLYVNRLALIGFKSPLENIFNFSPNSCYIVSLCCFTESGLVHFVWHFSIVNNWILAKTMPTDSVKKIKNQKTRSWTTYPNFLIYDFWPDFMKRKVPETTKFVFLAEIRSQKAKIII